MPKFKEVLQGALNHMVVNEPILAESFLSETGDRLALAQKLAARGEIFGCAVNLREIVEVKDPGYLIGILVTAYTKGAEVERTLATKVKRPLSSERIDHNTAAVRYEASARYWEELISSNSRH